MTHSRKKPRELTGRIVLLCLVAFFSVVAGVNIVMVKAAMSTFGGVETTSSYKAGLMFSKDMTNAERQEERHWHVDGKLLRNRDGAAVLDISARDAQGAPLTGLTARARLAHPADERLDHVIELARIGAGRFHGETPARAGQWELLVDLYRGEARVFRSRSRVSLK